MADVMVVFGSQSRLLEPLYDRPSTTFFRIYNSSVPAARENCVDVGSEAAFKEAFSAFIRDHEVGKIIFVGAAFKTQNALFLHEKMDDVRLSLETNIYQYVDYANFLLPFMIKKKSGVFVYLSSFRSDVTARGVSLYAASKAFGEKFFEVLGKEYGRLGITSTAIRMGYFDGRMTDIFDEDKIRKLKTSIGVGRLGNANDLVNAIEFAIANPYTSGGVIDLAGGINFE